MEEVYGYIYLIENNITGQRYIGKRKYRTKYHKKRLELEKYFGSGKYLKNAIKTYGKDNFSINLIDYTYSEKDSCSKEQFYISYFNTFEDETHYNLTPGGEVPILKGKRNPWYGKHHSLEAREKMSIALKKFYENKENHPMYGKHHPLEAREKMSKAKKGKYVGEKNPMYGKHHKEQFFEKVRGEKHHSSILTEKQVLEILSYKNSGKKQKEVAAIYGCSKSCVNNIWNGYKWNWLTKVKGENNG